jgi:hypothetical protein
MSALQVAAVLAAAVIALWPQFSRLATALTRSTPSYPVAEKTPAYLDAMADLARVRLRLRSTDLLDDDRRKAIDALTLALVEGSDV